MQKYARFALTVVVFFASLAGGFYVFRKAANFSLGNAVQVDWRLLADLDYVTGKATGELSSLDGAEVRVPGFMVPLEDNSKRVTEFLLVPSPQACIHVPPPPPNQMVLVQMASGSGVEVAFGPVWVYGILRIQPKRHLFGESSFQMEGSHIETYRPD